MLAKQHHAAKLLPLISKTDLQNHCVCFLHLPKTAGSSFTKIVEKLVGIGRFRVLTPGIVGGLKEPEIDVNQYQGISGHFSYEIHKLIKNPILFLTFLRDTVSRTISQYHQFRRIDFNDPEFRNTSQFEKYHAICSMSLEEFVQDQFFQEIFSNLQTRMLGLLVDRPIQYLKETVPYDRGEDRIYSLELAKERLRNFTFIGLQDRFQESMDIFSYQFGIPPITSIPKLNVKQNAEESVGNDNPLCETIRELNRLDVELYEYATKLFEERATAMKETLNARFQLSVHDMLALKQQADQVVTDYPYRYDFEGIIHGSGWHPVEVLNDNYWTWSGPEPTSILHLPLDRTAPLSVSFSPVYCIDVSLLEKLELYVDDDPVHLEHRIEQGQHFFEATIPAAAAKRTLTKLSFHLERTVYPAGMNAESPGARLLGFALSSIDFTKAAASADPASHSCRNASIGSMRAARKAG